MCMPIIANSFLDIVFHVPLRNACLELGHKSCDHVIVHVWHRLRVFDLFLKLKHKVGKQGRQRELADHLYECFPDADAAPAQKRRETVRVAPLATRRQEVATLGIEALRDEVLRLDPLGRVVAEAAHHDGDWVALAYLELLALGVF